MLSIRPLLIFATLAIVVSAQAGAASPYVAERRDVADDLLQQKLLQEGKVLESDTFDADKLDNILAAKSSKERRDASSKVRDRLNDRVQNDVKVVDDEFDGDLEQGRKWVADAADSVHHGRRDARRIDMVARSPTRINANVLTNHLKPTPLP